MIALAATLLPAAAAERGTLSSDGQTVRYVAAPGEVNQARFFQFSADIGFGAGTVSMSDAGAPVTAVEPGCFYEQIGSGSYWHCRDLAPSARIVVELGDRNDDAYMGGNPFSQVEMDGGDGDDRLGGAQT